MQIVTREHGVPLATLITALVGENIMGKNIIRQQKDVAGQVGVKSLPAVESLKNAAFPDEQVRIVPGEFIPGLAAAGIISSSPKFSSPPHPCSPRAA